MAGLIKNQTIAPESVGTGFAPPKIRKDRDSSFLAHGQRNQNPCFLHLVCFLVFYGLLFHSLTPVMTGNKRRARVLLKTLRSSKSEEVQQDP